MSETQSTEKTPTAKLTDTLIDLGLTWADMGIGLGKNALESTAHALEATAKQLGEVQGRLRTIAGKHEATEKPNEVQAPSA